MEHIVKKVIMASAGTGKTYRLSLEFISLLLKYKEYEEFDFSQIVVMTFTRKATAEIREKILDFLQELAEGGEESMTIIANLEKISGYKWQANDQEYIKTKLLSEILQRKDLLQVSTIDSFTTNIFKSMIGPYLRIKEFNIDNNSNDEIMHQLLEFIFSDQIFPIFEPLLRRLNIRTVEDSQGFLNSLINNRWVLDYYDSEHPTGQFMAAMNLDSQMINEVQQQTWETFKQAYLAIIQEYNERVYEPQDKPWHKLIPKAYKYYNVTAQKMNLKAVNYDTQSLLSGIESNLETALNAYLVSLERIQLAKLTLDLNEEIFQQRTSKFQANLISVDEYLDSQVELEQAREQYNSSLYGFLKTESNLRRTIGLENNSQLTNIINLALEEK